VLLFIGGVQRLIERALTGQKIPSLPGL